MKRMLQIMLCTVFCAFLITGCGKNTEKLSEQEEETVTTKDVLNKLADYSFDTAKYNVQMDIDVAILVSGLNVNFSVDVGLDGVYEEKKGDAPAHEYMKMQTDYLISDASGTISQGKKSVVEIYDVFEDDRHEKFYSENNKQWRYEEDDEKAFNLELKNAIKGAAKNGFADKVLMSSDVKTDDGYNCYKLTYKGTVKEFIEAFGEEKYVETLLDFSAYGLDSDRLLGTLDATIDLYVDDSQYCVRMLSVSVDSVNMSKLLASLGTDASKLGVENIEVKNCSITLNISDYNEAKAEKPNKLNKERAKKLSNK